MLRSETCDVLREHFDQVKLMAMERFVTTLGGLDVEEVCRKIMEGDVKFPAFNLDSLNPLYEFHGEVIDSIAYMLFSMIKGDQARD